MTFKRVSCYVAAKIVDKGSALKGAQDVLCVIFFLFLCCVIDFPAGHTVKFLVGFSNKGGKDFIVDTMDAAFRYPQDYSFYIQNVSTYHSE